MKITSLFLHLTTFMVIFFIPFLGSAQNFPRLDLPFIEDDSFIATALAGGLNSPQFSAVDLNGDDIQDLYIFDRHGNISLTFLWNEHLSTYNYAPEYEKNFPKMQNWVLLRDYNQDGIQDIFTQTDVNTISGAKVFRGKMENGKIAFDAINFDHEFAPILTFMNVNNERGIINIGTAAYPGVDDIDGDGDFDILIPNFDGSHIYFFSNQTIEQNVSPDDFPFILADDCWGDFFVSGMKKLVNLSSNPNECATAFQAEPTDHRLLHNGNALLTIDMDNDGDKEFIFGDILHNNLSYLFNDGTAENAWMTSQDTLFPSYDVPAIIQNYVSPFYLDVDGDGLKDLMACPTALTGRGNNAWFYKNTQSNEQPIFELQKQTFLSDQMVDLGAFSHPVFVDYNMDGLLDLVVGNFIYFNDIEAFSSLYLYENEGTATQPVFELVNRNWLNLKQFNLNLVSYAPTFGDLDNDGDLDIVVGEENGTLLYAENTAGADQPMIFGDFQLNWQGIDVGKNSTPQLVDLNRDGTLDLVIGERTGNVNFLPNQGTPETPVFHPNPDEAPNNFFLGEINVISPDFPIGQTSPLVLDFADGFHIFLGILSGNVRQYKLVNDNVDQAFDLIDEQFGDFYIGLQARPAIADMDNDGMLEMIVGNARGGLSAFQTNLAINGTVNTPSVLATPQIQFYPNPTNSLVNIEWNRQLPQPVHYALFDTFGRLVQEGILAQGQTTAVLDISKLTAGVYFFKMNIDHQWVVKSLVKS